MTGESTPDETAVGRTYDRIAEHFARTRAHPWPEVTAFLSGDPIGLEADGDPDGDRHPGDGLGLDLGCGNGRHLGPLLERVDHAVGVDLSRGLLDAASERVDAEGVADRTTLTRATATRLPLRENSVDRALYVAALHHLPSRARRIGSLDELARVLGNDARALVSVWSTEHDRFDREVGFDTRIDWTLPSGERVPRFYHVYDPDEFERDLARSALTVEASVVSSGNCYAVVG